MFARASGSRVGHKGAYDHEPLRGDEAMRKLGIAAVLLGMLCIVPSTASAQVKVFLTTSGTFGPFNIQGLVPSLPKEKARDITIPISMWVIDHPKGLVVFDTGNNAAISDGACKSHWVAGNCDFLKPSQKRDDVIDMQLKKLGYSADKVKAVITSHAHLDHIGNIKLFPKRSEEHTSELQSLAYLVCRLLLEKKKKSIRIGCSDWCHVG